MFCRHCGKEINDTAKFCSGCGELTETGRLEDAQNKAVIRANKGLVSVRKSSLVIFVIAVVLIAASAIVFMIFGREQAATASGGLPEIPDNGVSAMMSAPAETTAGSVEAEAETTTAVTEAPATEIASNLVQNVTDVPYKEGRYTGEWQYEMPNGQGTLTDGETTVTGRWINGVPYGDVDLSIITDDLKVTYKGNFTNGVVTGEGTITEDTSAYSKVISGELVDGNLNGEGKYQYKDLATGVIYTYEGTFVDGNAHGSNVKLTEDHGSYKVVLKGPFAQGKPSGVLNYEYYQGNQMLDSGTIDPFAIDAGTTSNSVGNSSGGNSSSGGNNSSSGGSTESDNPFEVDPDDMQLIDDITRHIGKYDGMTDQEIEAGIEAGHELINMGKTAWSVISGLKDAFIG